MEMEDEVEPLRPNDQVELLEDFTVQRGGKPVTYPEGAEFWYIRPSPTAPDSSELFDGDRNIVTLPNDLFDKIEY